MENKLIKGRIGWFEKGWQLIVVGVFFAIVVLVRFLFEYLPDPNARTEDEFTNLFLIFIICIGISFLSFLMLKNDYMQLEFTKNTLLVRNLFDGKIKTEIPLSDIILITVKGRLHYIFRFKNKILIEFKNNKLGNHLSIRLHGYSMREWEQVLQEFELRNIPYQPEKSFFANIVKTKDEHGLLHLEYKFDINN